jgi:ubiquinone/menaquinone biosynthesis C-methylase UbiE
MPEVSNFIWDTIFSSQEWGKYPSESLIQFIARNFYKRKRDEVYILEIGCGPGANIWYLSREGFKAYGIDGSTVAVDIAKKRLQSEQLIASFKLGDVKKLPYEGNYFDVVIDNECMYANSESDSHKILSEVKRVLKPGGLFYSRTFSEKMFIGNSYKQYSTFEFDEIKEGNLAGKGFVRLINEVHIQEMYGKYFTLKSVDFLSYSSNNKSNIVEEYIIIASKNE